MLNKQSKIMKIYQYILGLPLLIGYMFLTGLFSAWIIDLFSINSELGIMTILGTVYALPPVTIHMAYQKCQAKRK